MKVIPLDKIIKTGIEYRTDKRACLRIKKIGTDIADKVVVKVDRVPVCEIHADFAPLKVTSSNKLGPIDLGPLFIAVPPDTPFSVESASSGNVRIIGDYIQLDPGESPPGDVTSRAANQGKNYVTYLYGTYSLGTDVAWPKDAEYTVIEITPKTIEKYTLNRIIMASVSGGTVNPGDFALRFYIDNVPLEYIYSENLQIGIDVLSAPYPPSDTNGEVPFSLAQTPITVMGDHTLTIKVKNTSGADKAPATGSSWTVKVLAVVEYLKQS